MLDEMGSLNEVDKGLYGNRLFFLNIEFSSRNKIEEIDKDAFILI